MILISCNQTFPEEFVVEFSIFINSQRPMQEAGPARLRCMAADPERLWRVEVETDAVSASDGLPASKMRRGWREFAAAMALALGDVLFFKLKGNVGQESSLNFDVHIIRGNLSPPSFVKVLTQTDLKELVRAQLPHYMHDLCFRNSHAE
jgi:hypothetical protein